MVLCAGAVLILWWAGLPRSPDFFVDPASPIIYPVVGGGVPPFSATSVDEQVIRIESGLGYPLVINFWGVWCAPCVEEMPVLERLYQQNIPVIGVHVGDQSPQVVGAWLQEAGISFPVVVDDRQLEQLFRVRGIPSTFFINSDGIIQHIENGALTEPSLSKGLAALGI